MLTSVLHRVSGIALAVGSVFVFIWLCAAASGPETFNAVNGLYASWFGQLLMFGWTLALFYHLCNGIRHLVWDAGYGFEIKTAETASYVVFAAAIALTIIVWLWALIA